jgi:hypothetical protein
MQTAHINSIYYILLLVKKGNHCEGRINAKFEKA